MAVNPGIISVVAPALSGLDFSDRWSALRDPSHLADVAPKSKDTAGDNGSGTHVTHPSGTPAQRMSMRIYETVRTKFWAELVTALVAVKVMPYTPAVATAPDSFAFPLPMSVRIVPEGSGDPTILGFG